MMKSLNAALLVLAFSATLFGGVPELGSKERLGVPGNGKILYNKLKCNYCHKINGDGGDVGPDLTAIGAKAKGVEWHIKTLTDPRSTHPRHPTPHMPKFDKLTDKMLLDLASYLESLK